MHAVLLAAGIGARLSEITGGGPKCLLPFGGASLLERHLKLLAGAGIHRLTVVTGFESMQIEQALAAVAGDAAPQMTITTRLNPDFRHGSALSVLAVREVLEAGDDVLLMDADVLYDHRMLASLMNPGRTDVLLIDRDVEIGDPEPVKVALSDARVQAFAKRLPDDLDYDTLGESVGFFCLTPATARLLVTACERVSQADADAPHEAALQEVMTADGVRFVAADATGLPWIEIDFPADVDRAVDDILPRLETDDAR